MVVIDRLSMTVHAITNRRDDTAEMCVKLLVDEVYCSHGLPLEIVLERDTKFTFDFGREVMSLLLTVKQGVSTSYHPRTDGQTKRTNRTLQELIRSFISSDERQALCAAAYRPFFFTCRCVRCRY